MTIQTYSLQEYQCLELWGINPDPIDVVNNIYHVLAQTPKQLHIPKCTGTLRPQGFCYKPKTQNLSMAITLNVPYTT